MGSMPIRKNKLFLFHHSCNTDDARTQCEFRWWNSLGTRQKSKHWVPTTYPIICKIQHVGKYRQFCLRNQPRNHIVKLNKTKFDEYQKNKSDM